MTVAHPVAAAMAATVGMWLAVSLVLGKTIWFDRSNKPFFIDRRKERLSYWFSVSLLAVVLVANAWTMLQPPISN